MAAAAAAPSRFKEESATIEALMLDSNDLLITAGVSTPVNRVDKTVADLHGEQLKGGPTIVYATCRNSDESAYVMQAVTAISHSNGPFPSLGIKHTATRVLQPNTNNPKTNVDSYKQHIFVLVNKHCPKLREKNGLVSILEILATWLNTHTFSRKDGLVEKVSFCRCAPARGFDRTNESCPRKLGDIILLSEAIAIVEEVFPTNLDRDLLETKITPACFSQPYPEEMCRAFHLV